MNQNTNTNPYFRLSQEQSVQLREIFRLNDQLFDQERAGHLSVVLSAEHIRLSFKQLYAIVRTITKGSDQVMPDWIFDLLAEKTSGVQ